MFGGDVFGGYVTTIFVWVSGLFIAYFIVIDIIYIMFVTIGVSNLRKYRHYVRVVDFYSLFKTTLSKPISILVPAFKEEASIIESVRSLLALKYPQFEVIVIDDGSTDRTLEVLVNEFDLTPRSKVYQRRIETEPILATYESDVYPNLVVVQKVNGGKSDALNCGINVSQYPYFCVLDADSVLERDALLKMIRPVIQEPETTIAVGGIVRVGNNCEVDHGQVKTVSLPTNWWVLAQVVEYLQAFLASRVALSELKCVLLISGAFGLFKKSTVIDVGGYRTDTIGEDMELVVRMNRHMRNKNQDYRIVFTPDPICWTEAPATLSGLWRQRRRWQKGMIDSLRFNFEMMLNPRYGRIGLFAMPYYLLELIGPIFEFFGYVFIIWFVVAGVLGWTWVLIFFLLSAVFGMLVTAFTILLEEISFHRYPRPRDLFGLLWGGIILNVIFRQINAVIRTWATIEYIFGFRRWGEMSKTGFRHKPTTEVQ